MVSGHEIKIMKTSNFWYFINVVRSGNANRTTSNKMTIV